MLVAATLEVVEEDLMDVVDEADVVVTGVVDAFELVKEEDTVDVADVETVVVTGVVEEIVDDLVVEAEVVVALENVLEEEAAVLAQA